MVKKTRKEIKNKIEKKEEVIEEKKVEKGKPIAQVDKEKKEKTEVIEDEVKEEEKSEKGVATVHYQGNKTREYSKKLHGENYKKLAAQFAEKFDGEVK